MVPWEVSLQSVINHIFSFNQLKSRVFQGLVNFTGVGNVRQTCRKKKHSVGKCLHTLHGVNMQLGFGHVYSEFWGNPPTHAVGGTEEVKKGTIPVTPKPLQSQQMMCTALIQGTAVFGELAGRGPYPKASTALLSGPAKV